MPVLAGDTEGKNKNGGGCGGLVNNLILPNPCPPPGLDNALKNRDLANEIQQVERAILEDELRLSDIQLSLERKRVSALHPLLFGLVYFPQWYTCQLAPFHWRMGTCFRDLWRYAVCAPVGSGKTVQLSKTGLLWSVFCERPTQLLLISLSADMASTWLNEMGLACAQSDELKADYGEFMGSHWGSSDMEFIFKAPEGRILRRCVLMGRGIGCAVRGLRPDRIVIDDPQDENNVKTEKVRDDFIEWLKGALLTRLDTPSKKLTYVATAFDEFAYICDLVNNPLPGWVTESFAIMDDTGNSIWPEKYPNEVLQTRRLEMGEARFQADFMNAPLRNTGRKWPFRGVNLQVIDGHSIDRKSWVTLAVDPSFTSGGDPWAVTMVEQTRNGMWYVLECESENNGLGPCLETILGLLKTYKGMVREMAVEVGGGGQGAMKFNLEDLSKRRNINLPGVRWLSHTAKKSKEQRILQLLPLAESGRIVLKPRHGELREQLLSYEAGNDKSHDDMVDSLSMHLEVQIPRSDIKPVEETPDEARHRRFMDLKKVRDMGKTPENRSDKWLGLRGG